MNTLIRNSGDRGQRGAALIVSLLLLLVLTILALSASQTSRLQERMAGNNRDYELAFQAAETAARATEEALLAAEQTPCADTSDPTNCPLVQKGGVTAVPSDSNETWWNSNTRQYGTSGQDMAGLHADPRTIAEEIGKTKVGGLDIGQGAEQTRDFYKVTANGFGRSQNARVVLESVVIAQPK